MSQELLKQLALTKPVGNTYAWVSWLSASSLWIDTHLDSTGRRYAKRMVQSRTRRPESKFAHTFLCSLFRAVRADLQGWRTLLCTRLAISIPSGAKKASMTTSGGLHRFLLSCACLSCYMNALSTGNSPLSSCFSARSADQSLFLHSFAYHWHGGGGKRFELAVRIAAVQSVLGV